MYHTSYPSCQALSRRLRAYRMLLKSVYSLRIVLQGFRYKFSMKSDCTIIRPFLPVCILKS